jgi:hypothetical protein
MDGVERRQLAAQGTHGAIVSNIFHCKRPRFTSTAYSAACERVIMIMRENYFLDLLAMDSPPASSNSNTSSTPVLRTLPSLLSTVQIFAHSGAEVHRLSAHRAQAS